MDAVSPPPVMVDTLDEDDTTLAAEISASAARQEELLRRAGQVAMGGGAALMIAVVLILLMRLTSGSRLWAPSLGVAVAGLLIGLALFDARVDGPGDVTVARFTDYHRNTELASAEEAFRALATELSTLSTSGLAPGDYDDYLGLATGLDHRGLAANWRYFLCRAR